MANGPIHYNMYLGKVTEHTLAIDHYWNFKSGVKLTAKTRRDIRQVHGHRESRDDIFVTPEGIGSYGKNRSSERTSPFESNVTRPMRFQRDAFLKMIKFADEIDFGTSPVCFRNEHVRGMLVEHTLGNSVPEFDEASN